MPVEFAPDGDGAVPLHVVGENTLEVAMAALPAGAAAWAASSGFEGKLGSVLTLPDADGRLALALAGYGTVESRARGRFHLAAAAAKLPAGDYRLEGLDPERLAEESLGWLLAGHAFDRYKSRKPAKARLVAPQGVDAARILSIARGECLTRDLIDTPASDMGPGELEAACADLAETFGASFESIRGDALLERGFPMIHAVGKGSDREPRLVDMSWGGAGPSVVLVGKGVCFDTGGLNLKPTSGMALMKKDMGGAATVLGLARMIMEIGLAMRLRVLIPAVENAVGGRAYRPGDVLTARSGLTVEITNTDAEGRLVLADALALGAESAPDLMVSMATLTGAARVAVGPDLSPYFTDDDALAQALDAAAGRVADPVWRMPLHDPYERMIEAEIADLLNAPKTGFAGAVTAALFLRRFVGAARHVHFDIYGWTPTAAPARPVGGVGMGARALLEALPEILGL